MLRTPSLFRTLAVFGSLFAALAASPSSAQDAYPSKPIRVIACCAGIIEAVTRQIGEEMSATLKQAVVVEPRPGASGMIGAELVSKARPDGYTIFIGTNSTHAANQSLFKSVPYDFVKDFVPVAGIGEGVLVLVVPINSTIKSLADLTARAKSQPGKLTFGWASSSTRLSMELYNQLADIKITDVPYKTNPQATTDLVGGQIDMMFADMNTAMPLIRAGRLRALALSGTKRSPTLPDVPTMQEAGVPGYNLTWWAAAWAPAGTPQGIVDQLNAAVTKAINAPKVQRFFETITFDAMPLTSDGLMKFQIAEHGKWAAIIKKAGIEAQ